eukprot:UC1_evm1s1741
MAQQQRQRRRLPEMPRQQRHAALQQQRERQGEQGGQQQLAPDLRALFSFFDSNGDGEISRAEMADMFRSAGHNPSAAEIDHIFSQVDIDRDGVIGYREFEAVMQFKLQQPPQRATREIIESFRIFDLDRSGKIPMSELSETLTKLGERLPAGEVEAMLEIAASASPPDGGGARGSVAALDYKKLVETVEASDENRAFFP